MNISTSKNKMFVPATTYRIQFCPDYTFNHLGEDLGYLKALGISTIYASPIFKARPGSNHGYDIIDMCKLNPELGTKQEFESLIEKLHKLDMTWIQDIVPNHMAFIPENEFIFDTLEKGKNSEYAKLFDIFWDHHDPELANRLMVPFLGSDPHEANDNKELILTHREQGFVFKYYQNHYPLNLPSYVMIFEAAEKLIDKASKKKVWNSFKELWKKTNPGSQNDVEHFKNYFREKILQSEFLYKTIEIICDHFNNSPDLLKTLHRKQHYQLCHWKETEKRINYRRFFTVNDLICVSVENEEVFNSTHKLVKEYCLQGVFQGVRIDHIDGLLNPKQYLDRLRNLLGDESYIVVEKILARNEKLDKTWPIQGTTGYDFLGYINELFIDHEKENKFDTIYKDLVSKGEDLHKLIYDKKRFILLNRMTGELNNLWDELAKLLSKKINEKQAFEALSTLLASLPVYRTYIEVDNPEYPEVLDKAFENAIHFDPAHQNDIEALKPYFNGADGNNINFIRRFQQLSGPLAAKGVEDTLYYTYNRFIVQNEVGDEPDVFGLNKEVFQQYIDHRFANWPNTMNTTSTHDTKRGEDTRARLAVISEFPELWETFISEINDFHFLFKPERNDRYLIWQSIIGAWPMDERPDSDFQTRLKQFIQKALREGKSQTSWADPDYKYEEACYAYCDALLENHESKILLQQLIDQIKIPGILKALGQVIIKLTVPGVADIYQGSELWNLSFVDPDNRKLVDYQKRKKYLFEIQQAEKNGDLRNVFFDLWLNKIDEKLKFYIIYRLLQQRINNRALFLLGELIPLACDKNQIAYFRKYQDSWMFVNIPLKCHDVHLPYTNPIELPKILPNTWQHVFTGDTGSIEEMLKINSLTVLTNI